MEGELSEDMYGLTRHLKAQLNQISMLFKAEKNQDAYKLTTMLIESIGFYKRYWGIDFSGMFPGIIAAQPAYQLVMAVTSLYLREKGMFDAAACVAEAAAALNVPGNFFNLLHIHMLREAGRYDEARRICMQILENSPDDQNILSELAQCEVSPGFWRSDYYQLLDVAHRTLRPETYLEIGVAQGRSLALAHHGTRAVGVDPDTAELGRMFFISPENNPSLFRMTSDVFFNSHDLSAVFAAKTVELVFLDGLHLFEQTLKDFINVEKFAGPETVVFIHDCLPINQLVAERERKTAFWVGDVWRIVPCLKEIRPELEIVTFPAAPSGLAMVRNLDPASRVLDIHYESIVKHYLELALPDQWDDKLKMLNVTDMSLKHILGFTPVERKECLP